MQGDEVVMYGLTLGWSAVFSSLFPSTVTAASFTLMADFIFPACATDLSSDCLLSLFDRGERRREVSGMKQLKDFCVDVGDVGVD